MENLPLFHGNCALFHGNVPLSHGKWCIIPWKMVHYSMEMVHYSMENDPLFRGKWSIIPWKWSGKWSIFPDHLTSATPRTADRPAQNMIWPSLRLAGLNNFKKRNTFFLRNRWWKEISDKLHKLSILCQEMHSMNSFKFHWFYKRNIICTHSDFILLSSVRLNTAINNLIGIQWTGSDSRSFPMEILTGHPGRHPGRPKPCRTWPYR